MGEIRSITQARKERRQGKQGGGGGEPGGGKLPVIKIIGGELPRVVDESEAALIAAGGHNLYQRGGEIVRPVVEELPGIDGTKTTGWRIVPATRAHIRERCTLSAQFIKFNTRDEEVRINCPPDVVETLMGRTGLWKLPVLTGIINTPILRSDGTLLDAPGYDASTGLLFEPEGQQFPPIPPKPTKEDADAARDVFVDLLKTFPFSTPADLAVEVSAIVTAVVRRSLKTAPLHAFDAPVAGNGKSLLVDLASLIATGRSVGVISQGKDDKEMESRIVAALLAGHAMISLDNCDRPLGGALLCQALSEERLNLRRLGVSDLLDTPMNASFFATGNNLTLLDDLVRRALRATIDAEMERPELREFATNPRAQIRADRGKYVAAALTIVRAYQVAGMPGRLRQLGSYEQWSDRVRSALSWVGLADPCDTMAKAAIDDPVKGALAAVLTKWQSVIGSTEVTTHQVINTACSKVDLASAPSSDDPRIGTLRYPEFKAALEMVAGKNSFVDAGRLGTWLRSKKGRMVGGMRIMRLDSDAHGGNAKWYLEKVHG